LTIHGVEFVEKLCIMAKTITDLKMIKDGTDFKMVSMKIISLPIDCHCQ